MSNSRVLLLLALLPGGGALSAQHRPPDFKLQRTHEDYAYLGTDSVFAGRNAWERLKFVPLSASRNTHLSVGGEIRQQYEYLHNGNWSAGPAVDDGYLLQRYMLHTDWHFSTSIRVFGQLKSAVATGKAGGPEPPDEDRLDLHQAFAEVHLPAGPEQRGLTLRVGRQEFSYGSSRLVSVREGPNVRQSFDAVKTVVELPSWQLDGFVSHPVETNRGVFDDGPNKSKLFWGVYFVHQSPPPSGPRLDVYYFGLRDQDADFEEGTATERRHTLGLRLWNERAPFTYNLEAAYQLGSFGAADVRAYTVSANVVRTWTQARRQPYVELRTEIISGDQRPADGRLQTFNPLFPKGAYFGQIALIGPANLIDIHPLAGLMINPACGIAIDAAFFWRYSPRDGLYTVPYELTRESGNSQARFIGSQYTLTGTWELNGFLSLEVFGTYFQTGRFLFETGTSRNITYLAPRLTLKF